MLDDFEEGKEGADDDAGGEEAKGEQDTVEEENLLTIDESM